MLAIGTLVIGGSLLGFGFYLDNQLMKAGGLLSLSYPAGVCMRKIVDEKDKEYFQENNLIYPRQNNSQKHL